MNKTSTTMTTHRVYAKCFGGRDCYLQVMFEGNRYQCQRYVRERARNGSPTHFLFISSLDLDAASRRYL